MKTAPWIGSLSLGLVLVLASAAGAGFLSQGRAQTSETRPCQDITSKFWDDGLRDEAVSMIEEYIDARGFDFSDACCQQFLNMFRTHGATKQKVFSTWLRWTFRKQKDRDDINTIVNYFQSSPSLGERAVGARSDYLTIRTGDVVPNNDRVDIGDTLSFKLYGRNYMGDKGEEIAGPNRHLTPFDGVRVEVEPPERGRAWFPSDDAQNRGEGYFLGSSDGEAKLVLKNASLERLGETVITVFDSFQLEFGESLYHVHPEKKKTIRITTQDKRNLEAGEELNIEVRPEDAFCVKHLPQQKASFANVSVEVLDPATEGATLTVSKSDGRGRASTELRVTGRPILFAKSRYDGQEGGDIENIELKFQDGEMYGGLAAEYWTNPEDMAAISVSDVDPSARAQVIDLHNLRWPPLGGARKGEFMLWARIQELGMETSVPIRVRPKSPTKLPAIIASGASTIAFVVSLDRRAAKNDRYSDGIARRDEGASQRELDSISAEVDDFAAQETVGWVATCVGVGASAYLWWKFFKEDREYEEKLSVAQSHNRTPRVFVTPDGMVGLSVRF